MAKDFDIERAKFLLNFSGYSRGLAFKKDANGKFVPRMNQALYHRTTFYLDAPDDLKAGDTVQYPADQQGIKTPENTWTLLLMEWSGEANVTIKSSLLTGRFLGTLREFLTMKSLDWVLDTILSSIGQESWARSAERYGNQILDLLIFDLLGYVLPHIPILGGAFSGLKGALNWSDTEYEAWKKSAIEQSLVDYGLSNTFIFAKDTLKSGELPLKEIFICFRESAGQEIGGIVPISNLMDFWTTTYQSEYLRDTWVTTPEGRKVWKDLPEDPLSFYNDLLTDDHQHKIRVDHSIQSIYYFPLRRKIIPKLRDTIREFKKKHGDDVKIKVSLAGFSLGGALSTLCALDVKINFPEVDVEIYTFGCPRIGNREFSQLFDQLIPNAYRIVKEGDMISAFPPMYHQSKVSFVAKQRIDEAIKSGRLDVLNPTRERTLEEIKKEQEEKYVKIRSDERSWINKFLDFILHYVYEAGGWLKSVSRRGFRNTPNIKHSNRVGKDYYYMDYAHIGTKVCLYDTGCLLISRHPVNQSSDLSLGGLAGKFLKPLKFLFDSVIDVFAKLRHFTYQTIGSFLGLSGAQMDEIKERLTGEEMKNLTLDKAGEMFAGILCALYNKLSMDTIKKLPTLGSKIAKVASPVALLVAAKRSGMAVNLAEAAGLITPTVGALSSYTPYVPGAMLLSGSMIVLGINPDNPIRVIVETTSHLTAVAAFIFAPGIGTGIAFISALSNLYKLVVRYAAEINSHHLLLIGKHHGRPQYMSSLNETCQFVKNTMDMINQVRELAIDEKSLNALKNSCLKNPTCVLNKPRSHRVRGNDNQQNEEEDERKQRRKKLVAVRKGKQDPEL